MLRSLLLLGLLLPLAAFAQAPYHILLENSRQFGSRTVTETLDSLATDSGKVAKRDVFGPLVQERTLDLQGRGWDLHEA